MVNNTSSQSLGTSPQCALVFGFHVSAHCGPGSIHDIDVLVEPVSGALANRQKKRTAPETSKKISWISGFQKTGTTMQRLVQNRDLLILHSHRPGSWERERESNMSLEMSSSPKKRKPKTNWRAHQDKDQILKRQDMEEKTLGSYWNSRISKEREKEKDREKKPWEFNR